MNRFTVRGTFKMREGWRSFEKVIEAQNEDVAREHTYAEFGSQHNLKRMQIEIEEVAA